MQKRVHSREFKREIVRQIATGQKRPAQVCREYGLAESVLSRWRKEYQERGEAAFEPLKAEGVTSQEQRKKHSSDWNRGAPCDDYACPSRSS